MKQYMVDGLPVLISDEAVSVIDSNMKKSPDALRIVYKQNGDLDCVMFYDNGKWWRLHRWLMAVHTADSDIYVDHKDGNVLNNQVGNLRLCTNAQNQMNARPHRDKTTGLPKGVTKSNTNPNFPYQVRISVLGTRIQVGYYATAEQAERAYLLVAEGLHGQFAYHTSRGLKNDS